jgi:hypothetical protein
MPQKIRKFVSSNGTGATKIMETEDGFTPRLPTRLIEAIPIALVIFGLLYWVYNSY